LALGVVLTMSAAALVRAAPVEQSAAAVVTSSSTRLIRVAFASPTNGVGLFETSTPADRTCAFFTRPTFDGGLRFAPAGHSIATTNCAATPPVDQIATGAVGDVFAFGPRLFVSDDDGTSWRAAPELGTIVAVATADASAWVLDASCNATENLSVPTCELTLVATSNAGRSWTIAPHQPPYRAVSELVVQYADLSTWFVHDGARTAYLAFPAAAQRAARATIVQTVHGRSLAVPTNGATFERTADGGMTWTTSSAPSFYGANSADLSVAADGALWLACPSEPGAGEQPKSIARSLDDGRSWMTSGPVCECGATAVGAPIGGYLGGLAAVSSTTVFFVGPRSSLTFSRDAMATWGTEPGFSGDAAGTSQVMFINTKDGWALDDAFGLWTTTDGGMRWIRR